MVWFAVVCLARYSDGSGHSLASYFSKSFYLSYEIASETIFGSATKMILSEAKQQQLSFTCMPFLLIVQAALASDRSLTFQATPFADEACETSRSLG